MKARIDDARQYIKLRLCGDKDGMINHIIISKCVNERKESKRLRTTGWGR